MKKGFTLIEVLIALFVLSMTVVGALSIISLNLANANAIKNSFIASGLAQEGLELTHNLRDNDWFNGRPFGSFGSSGVISDGPYRVQWNSSALISNPDNPPILKMNYGMYTYLSSGSPTIFKRNVQIKKVSAAEIVIVVDVTWLERGLPKRVSAEQHLYNWL